MDLLTDGVAQTLHNALVNHFRDQLGHVLLLKRKYELHLGEQESQESQRLPRGWNGILRPGDRVYMNALVEKPKDHMVIVCPACSTPIADRSAAEEVVSWMKWCETLLSKRQKSHLTLFLVVPIVLPLSDCPKQLL